MCIIVISGSGIEKPHLSVLQECFIHNPDGAGFMYAKNGILTIKKGFMAWPDFVSAYEAAQITQEHAIVYHFRIGTAGSISPENCHPFPLSNSPSQLKATTLLTEAVGVAHNGIFGKGDTKLDLSDTQVFIAQRLAHPDIIKNLADPVFQNLIGAALGWNNKLAVLQSDSSLWYYGEGWIKVKGCMYSNASYLPRPKTEPKYLPASGYDDWTDNFYESKDWRRKKYKKSTQPTVITQYDWKASEYPCPKCKTKDTLFSAQQGLWYCPKCKNLF